MPFLLLFRWFIFVIFWSSRQFFKVNLSKFFKVGAVKLTGSTILSNGAGILVVALLSFSELLTVKSCRSIRVAGKAFPRVAVKQIIIPTNVKSQKKARDTAST